jgi:hypothetical protein
MIDRTTMLRQVEAYLLEEISGAGHSEPFAAVERARLCSMLLGAPPAVMEAALDAIGVTLATLAQEVPHGQRQSVLREVRRSLGGTVDDPDAGGTAPN